ncbi:lipoprotein [Streptomyces sp. NPDC006798]|uniref:lipoprotein n=1 Tax=Streptomyces sp. NPDC006798 TaxID=3155462 RepID=UPI0033D5844E
MAQRGIGTGITVGAAVMALLATGCSGSDKDSKTEAEPSYDTKVKTQRIGAKGSTCALPFTFDTPASWKVTAANAALQEVMTMGMAEILCELDARHGGTSGFIRIYHDPSQSTTARLVAERAVDDSKLTKRKNVVYRDTKVGPYEAVEVSYEGYNEFWESRQKDTQIAFRTPTGFMVLDIGAMDPIDHDALLPELDRIKDTIEES